MALTEFQDLIEDMEKLLKEIEKDRPGTHNLLVCLPGTNRAFFNTY